MVLDDADKIVAILPLVTLRIGPVRKGYSLPLCTAGILSQHTENVFCDLKNGLSRDLDSLQISTVHPEPKSLRWHAIRSVCLDLTPSVNDILSSFGQTVRWEIRKSKKNGLHQYIVEHPDQVEEVQRLYHLTMKRRLSGGSFWSSLFLDLLGLPEDYRRISISSKDGRAIAFNIFLRFGDHAHYFAAGSDDRFHAHHGPRRLLHRNRAAKGFASASHQLRA